MPAFDLRPDVNNDPDEISDTKLERLGIVVILGLALLTVLMLSTLFYLY